MKNDKIHINKKAVICTTITSVLFIAALFFFGFKLAEIEEETGMLINFGNTETGSGDIEPAKSTPPPKVTPPPSPKPTPQPEESSNNPEDIETQDFEEAAAIEAAKKKEKERQEKIEQERELERQKEVERQKEIERQREIERQKQLEIERKRQEELERQEKIRKEQEAKAEAIRKQTANVFGKASGTSTSQGNNGGSGNQGSPEGGLNTNGKGLGTSGNWSLTGRNIVGSLPKPQYKIQESGVVVVEISVDKNGNVIEAKAIEKGSTTMNPELRRVAQQAALRAKFNVKADAQIKQIGTITYNFVIN